MTFEVRSARILLTMFFCCSSFLTGNKPNNALGACSWNFLFLNAPMFSSQHFGSESGNFDRLLLKHRIVPKISQTPRQWLNLRFRKYTTIGEFRIQSGTGTHFSSNR